MAQLIKNIDTRQYGPLKAGRLLNGFLSPEKIAELIASGHAELTEHDSTVQVVKNAENVAGEAESLFESAFSTGYACAINDAVDSGLISKEEAATCGLMVPYENDEVTADIAGGHSESTDKVDEKAGASTTGKAKKGTLKK